MDNPIWAYIFGASEVNKPLLELMKTIPAFDGLTTHELVTIERVIHQRFYKAGEMVFGENMPGAGMYIVKSGEISIRKKVEGCKEIELALITDHNFFGEMALIDEIPRSASAVVVKDAVLLAFCKPDLENVLDRNPKLALKIVFNIARLLCKRLVKANDNLEFLSRNTVQEK